MASLESELICHAILKTFSYLQNHRSLFDRSCFLKSEYSCWIDTHFDSTSCVYESSINLAVLLNMLYVHVLVGDWQLLLDKNRFIPPVL